MENYVDSETGEVKTLEDIQARISDWEPVLKLDAEKELEYRGKIATKIAKVYASIQNVGKDGVNKYSGYKYVTLEALYKYCRTEMSKVNLALIPLLDCIEDLPQFNADGNRKNGYMKGHFRFCLVDGDTGYTVVIPWVGEVNEPQDKGISKASGVAMKYCLRTLFIISLDDDKDEPDGAKPPKQSKAKKEETDIDKIKVKIYPGAKYTNNKNREEHLQQVSEVQGLCKDAGIKFSEALQEGFDLHGYKLNHNLIVELVKSKIKPKNVEEAPESKNEQMKARVDELVKEVSESKNESLFKRYRLKEGLKLEELIEQFVRADENVTLDSMVEFLQDFFFKAE